MKKVLIMYSGGVESSALVQYAIDSEIDFELLHVTHNNKSLKEMSAIKGAVHRNFPHALLHEAILTKQSFDEEHLRGHRDVSTWLGVAMAMVGRAEFDELWYGTHNKDAQGKIAKMELCWNSMMEIIETKTVIVSPLRTKSKLDQYKMLTPRLRECIISCAVIPKGPWNEPCGKCNKCEEFRRYVLERL